MASFGEEVVRARSPLQIAISSFSATVASFRETALCSASAVNGTGLRDGRFVKERGGRPGKNSAWLAPSWVAGLVWTSHFVREYEAVGEEGFGLGDREDVLLR